MEPQSEQDPPSSVAPQESSPRSVQFWVTVLLVITAVIIIILLLLAVLFPPVHLGIFSNIVPIL